MKHKILLATEHKADLENLLQRLKSLLNKTHSKYLSAYNLAELMKEKLVMANGQSLNGLGELVDKIEEEAKMESIANDFGMNFELIKSIAGKNRLGSLSTVFDLAVFESSVFDEYDESFMLNILEELRCSVLILPENIELDEIIVVNDGTMDSIRMVKTFLNTFDPELRNLPVSVYLLDPDTNFDIESEKVFVDYLKLYCKNIGVQMLCEDPVKSIIDQVTIPGRKPFLMPGVTEAAKEFNQQMILNKDFRETPIFIFKG